MTDTFRQDVDAMYRFAAGCESLDALVPALFDVLRRNEASLASVTYAYRLVATDTGYRCAFALDQGRFSQRPADSGADVTVAGKQRNLLAIFQRKLNPVTALLLGKIKVEGDRDALMALAAFL